MTFDEEHKIETFKSLITIAVEGLKTLLLVNGGAVVALLAFLGQSPLGTNLAPHFRLPILGFVLGLLFCVVAFVGVYFTQFALFNESFRRPSASVPNHMICLKVTILCVLLSVACFALGACASIFVLSGYTCGGSH